MITMTLDAEATRALARYAGSAVLEQTGMTLTLDGDLLVPRIDGFEPGDEIPVGV